jgi:hypothetical protein
MAQFLMPFLYLHSEAERGERQAQTGEDFGMIFIEPHM